MRHRLTDEYIRRHKPPATGQLLIWDDLVSGFGVRLTPTQTSFVVQWRESAHRKPRESLSPRFPQLKAGDARKLAQARLGAVLAVNGSPGSHTLRHAMRDWYARKLRDNVWRPRYASKVDSLIRHYIEGENGARAVLTPTTLAAIATLGAKPVASVSRADLMAVVDGIRRGAADQLMAITSSFYNDMLDRGIECPNPARNRLRRFGGRRVRSRVLTDAEVAKLWQALKAEGDPALTCFAVMAFTGCRRREATQMRWGELDLDAGTWTLPPERRKTGAKDPEPFVINLHPKLAAMLRRQPVLEGSPFVFWGRRDKSAFDFHFALFQRLRALDIHDWRLHDLRRYVRSNMAKLGVSQMVGELCLGHRARPGLVMVYDQHSYSQEMHSAWKRWGDALSKVLDYKRNQEVELDRPSTRAHGNPGRVRPQGADPEATGPS